MFHLLSNILLLLSFVGFGQVKLSGARRVGESRACVNYFIEDMIELKDDYSTYHGQQIPYYSAVELECVHLSELSLSNVFHGAGIQGVGFKQ